MSSSNTSCSSVIPLAENPDISGVGVRVSFYLQTFLLVLLVDRSWQDAPSALWTFIATSFGLTIAALVQASRKNLSLFQALQVSNLVWLANFGSFLALASYSRRKSGYSHHKGKDSKRKLHKPENYVKFGAMLQTLLSMILTEWLWVHADTLSDDCSPDVQYVLFVVKTSALGAGRIVALTITSVLTLGYVLVTFHELRSYYLSRKEDKQPRHHRKSSSISKSSNNDKDENPVSPMSIMSPSNSLYPPANSRLESGRSSSLTVPGSNHDIESTLQPPITTEPQPRHKKTRKAKTNRPRKKQWSGNWDPMLLGIAAFQVVVFTYFVVSSELLRKWNHPEQGGDQWQFGQILALIVIIPSALAVFNAFSIHGFKRLHKKRKGNRKGKSRQPTLDIV